MSRDGVHTRSVFLVPLRVPRAALSPGMVTGVSRGVVDSLSGRRLYIVKRTRPAYYVTGDGERAEATIDQNVLRARASQAPTRFGGGGGGGGGRDALSGLLD